MKNIDIKNKLRYFLILLVFGLYLSGCNSDDDNDDDPITTCDTFLACNDGTTWKFVETEDGIEFQFYIQLIDNKNNPFQTWFSFTGLDCGYDYFGDQSPQFELIENSKNILVIKVIWPEDDGFETWTITKQGETLKVVSVYYQEEQVILFNLTSENMDSFAICDE